MTVTVSHDVGRRRRQMIVSAAAAAVGAAAVVSHVSADVAA